MRGWDESGADAARGANRERVAKFLELAREWEAAGLSARMKNEAAPMLDSGLSALIADLDERGLLKETLVVCVGEFGRSPQRGVSTSGNQNQDDGRDHWPYCYTAVAAGAGVKRGFVYGKSDKTASAPIDDTGRLSARSNHVYSAR